MSTSRSKLAILHVNRWNYLDDVGIVDVCTEDEEDDARVVVVGRNDVVDVDEIRVGIGRNTLPLVVEFGGLPIETSKLYASPDAPLRSGVVPVIVFPFTALIEKLLVACQFVLVFSHSPGL